MQRAFRTCVLSLFGLLVLPWHAAAQRPATSPTRPIDYELVPCGFMTGDHNNVSALVVAFSEGTAWEGEKWVWLTVFNPLRIAQTVEVKAYVDGYGLVFWSESVPSKARRGWNMNLELLNRAGHRGRTNFATEVVFRPPSTTAGGGVGLANIAVWDYDYKSAVYLLGTNLCGVTAP